MFSRSRATVAGLTARTSAAIRPAAAGQPPHRPVEHQHGEDALDDLRKDDRPGVQAERPHRKRLHHNAPGSLSTVMVPAGSKAPKMKLCQLMDMLRSAAA